MLALEFRKGDGGCLAVVGGYGPVNDNVPKQVGAMYGRDKNDDGYQYCNEIHYYSRNKSKFNTVNIIFMCIVLLHVYMPYI